MKTKIMGPEEKQTIKELIQRKQDEIKNKQESIKLYQDLIKKYG